MARVLFWSKAFPPLIGGVEVLGARTVEELRRRGHDVVVVADQADGMEAHERLFGVDVYRFPMLTALLARDLAAIGDIRARVSGLKREFRPDVVWCYFMMPDTMFHGMSAHAHPAPTIATVHGEVPLSTLEQNTFARRLLETSDWVTGCSAHALEAVRHHLPGVRARSSAVLNGLAMPDLEPTPLPFDPPVLLCLGRLGAAHEKGFDVAIRAMPFVRDRFPNARLVIAGDGPWRASLERDAENSGVAEMVEFRGWVQPDAVPALINESTVMIVPSRMPEGFGLTALEGQQMARPVIASDTGGLPEVVRNGETGVLVPPVDPHALADAIVAMLADPDRARAMGAAGRRNAREHFGIGTHVDAYESIIERIRTGRAHGEGIAR